MKRLIVILLAFVLALVFFSACSTPSEEEKVAAALEKAEQYLSEDDYEAAIEGFSVIIETAPQNPAGYIGASKAYLAQDDAESALGALNDGFAQLANDESYLSQAILIHEEIVSAFPDLPEAYIDTARRYVFINNLDQALETLANGYRSTADPEIKSAMEILLPEAVTWMVPPIYSSVQPFSEGLAAVSYRDSDNQSHHGFINEQGEMVIPCDHYAGIKSFSEGLAAVMKRVEVPNVAGSWSATSIKEKWGYIDKNGNEVIPCEYDAAMSFSEGLAAVVKASAYEKIGNSTQIAYGKIGYIDTAGELVIPFEYDYLKEVNDSYDGYTMAVTKDPIGLYQFSEGMAAVPRALSEPMSGYAGTPYKFGYINIHGEEVIPFVYEEAYPFANGLALVNESISWNEPSEYIDEAGDTAFRAYSPLNSEGGTFSDGLAAVADENHLQIGYVDTQGEFVIPFAYSSMSVQSPGYAARFFGGYALYNNDYYDMASTGTPYEDRVGVITPEGEFTSFKSMLGSAYHSEAESMSWIIPSHEELVPFFAYQGRELMDNQIYYNILGNYGFIKNPLKYLEYRKLIGLVQ